MKIRIKYLAIAITAGVSFSADAQDGGSKMAKDNAISTNQALMDNKGSMLNLTGWPERPTLAVKEMMAKYGEPVEVSSEAIIWHNEGPYKRIMVTKKEVPHDFPMPHMDFL